MSIVRRIFPSDTDALRPRLACEITPTGVLAAWYPIKDDRTIAPWHAECVRALHAAVALAMQTLLRTKPTGQRRRLAP